MSLFSFFFSSRRRHTRCSRDWSSDVCSSDLSLRRRAVPGSGNSSPEKTRTTSPCSFESGIPSEKESDRKSTRLNSSHGYISYAVFCLKKKKKKYELTLLVCRYGAKHI